jgi:type III restriction enzyme
MLGMQGRYLPVPAQVQNALPKWHASELPMVLLRYLLQESSNSDETQPPEVRHPIKAVLDPYNPLGSTIHVNFNTSKKHRWKTDADSCHINWVILDSDWEAEFCRVAESHPQVKAYVKNHSLGFEVPYTYGSQMRVYLPDFIVLVDDGRDDPLHLVVEIKGYRGEDAKVKKATMDNYWVPGVNNLGRFGRWTFAEFTDVYQMEADFKAKIKSEFNKMIETCITENDFSTRGLSDAIA